MVHISEISGSDYEKVISLYGGEEQCKRLFPKTFEKLQTHEKGFFKSDGSIALRLLSARYKKNNPSIIEITAEMCASHVFYKRLDVIARSKDNPSVEIAYARSVEFIGDFVSVRLEFSAVYRNNCLLDLVGVNVSNETCLLWHQEDMSDIGLVDFDVTTKICAPKVIKEHSGSDAGKIVLSFAHWNTYYNADYPYDYYNGPFKLPSKGSITLDGHIFDSVLEKTLAITHEVSKKYMLHTNPSGVSFSDNQLSWDFPEDWGFQLSSLTRSSSNLIYELQFVCLLRGESKKYYFTVTNNTSIEEKPPLADIRYYCDCIAAGANIMLDNGLEIPIEKAEAGQVLKGNSKITGIVSGTLSGDLYKLTVFGGRCVIIVSGSHCILTDKGFLPADKLTVNTQLVIGDGNTAKLEDIVPVDDTKTELYNLLLDGGDGNIVANGFVLQGITDESLKVPSRERQRLQIAEEWLTDFDNLCRLEAGEKLWH